MPPGICLSFETGGKRAKREKNECDGKTTNLVVAKKKGGNRSTRKLYATVEIKWDRECLREGDSKTSSIS